MLAHARQAVVQDRDARGGESESAEEDVVEGERSDSEADSEVEEDDGSDEGVLDGVESDDGDGGQIKLSVGADLPAGLARAGGAVLPLGDANTAYAYGNFEQAREKLLEVVRICPSCPDAYTTLGLIHDERQEAGKALDFLIIAAHLTPKDAEMWADLAQRSRALGKLKQVTDASHSNRGVSQ